MAHRPYDLIEFARFMAFMRHSYGQSDRWATATIKSANRQRNRSSAQLCLFLKH
jgi:hypothetical protein